MRNNNFDLIRISAALGVFLSHGIFFYQGTMPSFFHNTQSIGSISVYIFFIVSGFLIFNSYQRNSNFFVFFTKRFLRIYPGLFVASFISVFVIAWIATKGDKADYFLDLSVWKVFFNYAVGLAHLHNVSGVFENNIFPGAINGSLWTIKYELACYFLLFFLLSLKIGISFLIRILLSTIVLIFILVLGFELSLSKYIESYSLLTFSFAFFIGSLAGLLKIDEFSLKSKFILFSFSFLILLLLDNKKIIDIFINIPLLFMVMMVAFNGFYFKINNDISYGIYIYAFPIQQLISQYAMEYGYSIWVYMIISLLLTWVMALLSWKIIEKPAIQWAQKITKRDHL